MSKPYFSVTIDCSDPQRLASFYGELLELSVVFQDGPYVVLGPVEPGTAHMIFQKVPESASGKNRAHVDLHVRDFDAAAKRVVELGGTVGDHVKDVGIEWTQMHDPEGNIFCMMPLTPTP